MDIPYCVEMINGLSNDQVLFYYFLSVVTILREAKLSPAIRPERTSVIYMNDVQEINGLGVIW